MEERLDIDQADWMTWRWYADSMIHTAEGIRIPPSVPVVRDGKFVNRPLPGCTTDELADLMQRLIGAGRADDAEMIRHYIALRKDNY